MDMHTHEGQRGHAPEPAAPPQGAATLKDPVCGMTVTEQSPHRLEREGSPYYFCSAKCQEKFTAEPAKFLAPVVPTHAAAPVQAEVARSTPARCIRRSGRTTPAIARSAA